MTSKPSGLRAAIEPRAMSPACAEGRQVDVSEVPFLRAIAINRNRQSFCDVMDELEDANNLYLLVVCVVLISASISRSVDEHKAHKPLKLLLPLSELDQRVPKQHSQT